MGKTPKKAAPGGDERNLYVRRLKATTATSETAAGASLPEKQRESESSNRPKLTGVQKKVPAVAGKKFKSKLRSPAKLSLKRSSKPSSAGQEQKPAEESTKRTRTPSPTMQTETGEAEMKQDTPVQEEAAAEENLEQKKKNDEPEETISKDESDRPIAEEILNQECENTKETELPETPAESHASEKEPCEIRTPEVKESEEQEESDIKLSLDAEESPTKSQEEPESKREDDDERRVEDGDSNAVQEEVKSVSAEKEDPQNEQHTDTESYSVDIVESTTSEISETSESVSPCEPQKEKDKPAEVTAKDASFVSYDASIMLKDVQIKLNDCLKDNSKLFDASNSESSPQVNRLRDMSFGKTLRSISGRSSLNRMRHVTVRENRFSPNSSLFVNTSTMSLPSEESSDCKVLRYASNLSETFPTNGSPVERKRKLDLDAWSSAKKRRTETESGLLDASMGLLKGLRKPVQVSTPSVAGYKFRSDKLNASDITDDEEKVLADGNEGGRKWCVVM